MGNNKATQEYLEDYANGRAFAQGYFSRIDAVRAKPKCKEGVSYPCGKICLSVKKNCNSSPQDEKTKQILKTVKSKSAEFAKAKGDPSTVVVKASDIANKSKLSPDKKKNLELADAAKTIGADVVLSSGIAEADPSKIRVDPKRFQYKIIGESTSSGEVGSLSGVKKWDSNLAGILQVWRDPEDGQVYVVNGHNRLALAKKLGAESVTVKFLDVKSPQEARAVGALTNIAEGRGNAMDSAKFFRDSGISKEELEKKGIPMREKIAQDGLALSNLSDSLFNRVVQGDIPESRAVVIGGKIKDHQLQQDVVELIGKEEKKGKKVTNDTIEELADMVVNAPTKTEEQGGLLDLLGFTPGKQSLAIEKAQIQASIKRQLSREKRLFATVGKSKAAKDLEKAGNKINVEESSEVADAAEKALRAFDQEKKYTGRVSELLNQAAERLSVSPKNQDKIIKETYEQVLDELQKTYKFGKGSSPQGSSGSSKIDREEDEEQRQRRETYERAQQSGQIDLFSGV